MKRRRTAEEKKRADDAYLLRAWKRYHAERLEEALAGVHRDVIARLLVQLKDLRSARELVAAVSAMHWRSIDADVRATALALIDGAIVALRERQGLAPFDDPLPGQPDSAFLMIRRLFDSFPPCAGERAEAIGKSEKLESIDERH
jgi:hypothetical protein